MSIGLNVVNIYVLPLPDSILYLVIHFACLNSRSCDLFRLFLVLSCSYCEMVAPPQISGASGVFQAAAPGHQHHLIEHVLYGAVPDATYSLLVERSEPILTPNLSQFFAPGLPEFNSKYSCCDLFHDDDLLQVFQSLETYPSDFDVPFNGNNE